MRSITISLLAGVLAILLASPVGIGRARAQEKKGPTATQESPLRLEEKALMGVLEMVRTGVRSGMEFEEFSDLLVEAQARLEILQKTRRSNAPFLQFLSQVCSTYQDAKEIWIREINFGSTDESRTARQSSWQKASEALDKAYQSMT
jgi:hypothetical protein